MANYCEDYPCCGHTDGLGCDWTYTDEAREYDQTHAFCDHPAGFCDVWAYDDQDEDDDDEDFDDPNYIGDDYYSGTGELIGDDSYIDYLNNY
jgi:hypothetical protein